jgi:hypothetical protein
MGAALVLAVLSVEAEGWAEALLVTVAVLLMIADLFVGDDAVHRRMPRSEGPS